MKLKALVPKDQESRMFSHWLEQGAFDAIERGYVVMVNTWTEYSR